tara:strand:+ start:254 stop:775 length:522 start_codon:yes stop_codon:yes gene_type:complete
MKYIVRTFKKRLDEAEMTKQSLIKLGVPEEDIDIIETYDWETNQHFQKTNICGKGFIDQLIPLLNEDTIYIEDTVEILKLPTEELYQDKLIVFLGFYKHRKDYIVGSKVVYINKKIISMWKDKPPRLAKMDRFFRREGLKYNSLGVNTKNDLFKVRPYKSFFDTNIPKKFFIP